MTSVLNVHLQNRHEKVYFIYNFSQVSDAILMVKYNNALSSWEELILNYDQDNWVTGTSATDNDIETLFGTSNFLQNITCQHHLKTTGKKFLSHHALLLLNACS